MPYSGFEDNGFANPQSVIDLADKAVRDGRDTTTVTLADDAVHNFGDLPDSNAVFLITYAGLTAIFSTDGGTVTVLTAGDATKWSIAVTTDTKTNFYITSSELLLENKSGGTLTYQLRRLA